MSWEAELGKYAHEDRMPKWLISLLRERRHVSSAGIIPVIDRLLQLNHTTQYAYLCHPCVLHISKLRREGGFCGYRNIQMQASYLLGTRAPGAVHFRGRVPSIFRIQDMIEDAWDMGFNAQGRIETGGIRGTRKYIGTPEAQAVFQSLEISCAAQTFNDPNLGAAELYLVEAVERYFQGSTYDPSAKVRRTSLAPLYFQHRGHSMTIVGLERRADGSTELLVFDPMFDVPRSVAKHVGSDRINHSNPDGLLKFYRRGSKYLKNYFEFELLSIS
jgi:hypothetical protein